MRRGRKPTPTQLKLARGNPGKRRIPDAPPVSEPSSLDPPTWLEGKAKEKWLEAAPQLLNAGLLATVDTDALVAYCKAYARWFDAEEMVRKFGMVITAPSGYPVQSPYVSIADKALSRMQAFHAEFGMTPSARTRVHVTKRPLVTTDAELQRERFFGKVISGGRR